MDTVIAQHGGELRAAKGDRGEKPEVHQGHDPPCIQMDHIPTPQALLVMGLLTGRTVLYESLNSHYLALRLDQSCHFSITSNDSQ